VAIAAAVEHAPGAVARLDSTLSATHSPPPGAGAGLEAIRRQTAVDGQAIDPGHLAALIEGVRFRLGSGPALIDRGAVFADAHHALALYRYRWLIAPDDGSRWRSPSRQCGKRGRTAPAETESYVSGRFARRKLVQLRAFARHGRNSADYTAPQAPDDLGIDRILRVAVRHDFPVNVPFWGNVDAASR
jgi:hypothetical protein